MLVIFVILHPKQDGKEGGGLDDEIRQISGFQSSIVVSLTLMDPRSHQRIQLYLV